MPEDWRKIEHGLFESADGRWRIANPYKLTTELRHRWLVAERRASGSHARRRPRNPARRPHVRRGPH
jgi:hypothetical protein